MIVERPHRSTCCPDGYIRVAPLAIPLAMRSGLRHPCPGPVFRKGERTPTAACGKRLGGDVRIMSGFTKHLVRTVVLAIAPFMVVTAAYMPSSGAAARSQ